MARCVQSLGAMSAQRPHVVVLAGGEGTRLATLTRALYGVDLPKQFAVLDGDRSLLQATIDRALALTTADRISVVVSAHHEATARAQLARTPGVELVVQPRNLDTAPGLLLPLVRILVRAPRAHVVFLPSDHYVRDAEPLLEALRDSAEPALAGRITLIGVDPTEPEIEYGWIERGSRLARTGAFAVRGFHEKPAAPIADDLFRAGALWNTFISAGAVQTYWELARRYLPEHVAALERYAVAIGSLGEAAALDSAYRTMAPANFSRDLLAHTDRLAVIPVAGTGWTDWGSPARVFATLAGTASHDRLVARIRGDLALAS